jgi:hypothetical protein
VKGTKTEIAPGVWRLRVYGGRHANGTPIQLPKTVRAPGPCAGTRLADRELAKLIAKVDRGAVGSGSRAVDNLIDEWLRYYESIGRSPTTLKGYRQIVEVVVRPELGSVRPSVLSARHLDRLYAKRTARGNKATTIRWLHAPPGEALAQAERWGYVEPTWTAEPRRRRSRRSGRRTSPEEVRAMLKVAEAAEPTLAVVLPVPALTRGSRGEPCALRWTDLDETAGTLTIARSVYEVDGGDLRREADQDPPEPNHWARRCGPRGPLPAPGCVGPTHRRPRPRDSARLVHVLPLTGWRCADPAGRPDQVHPSNGQTGSVTIWIDLKGDAGSSRYRLTYPIESSDVHREERGWFAGQNDGRGLRRGPAVDTVQLIGQCGQLLKVSPDGYHHLPSAPLAWRQDS